MKKRIVWIDLLRVIGILGVLIMHVVGNTINNIDTLPNNANSVYVFLGHLFEFSIPLFVMISGMMFLSKKDISFKDMITKYCLKIFLTITIIGSIMVIIEELYLNNTVTFKIVFDRVVSGELWAHMWYLYMILGLYLITPVLTLITNLIKEKEFKMFLIILFIFTILFNTLNINTAFSIGLSGYLFYYFYGYYLYKYDISKTYKYIHYLLAIISIVYIVYHVNDKCSLDYLFSYVSFVPFIIASSLILLFKDKDIKKCSNLITSIGVCSFGIYVYHQVFINIIYKGLKLDFIFNYPYIGIIVYIIGIFCLTYGLTYVLKKVKIINKYFV